MDRAAKKTGNPYTLAFGAEPVEMIPRMAKEEELIESFTADYPSIQAYMITGVRGSGKTVFMTGICKKLREKKDWVVVELNPERDLLTTLIARLSSESRLVQIFQRAKINLSYFGVGLSVEGTVPILDAEMAVDQMLSALKRKGKRILIAVDEVTNTSYMRVFAASFQIFLRHDLPVFLLMTGLYENIHALQNEKSLTFLYRTPRIEMGPLNIGIMADNYQRVFQVNDAEALRMAQMTRGYSFAFQVLGYFSWEKKYPDEVLPAFKQYLFEFVYEKIWAELPMTDKQLRWAIASAESGKINDIRELLHWTSNQMNPYRSRLIRKGIINGDDWGMVSFTLPLFEKFVLANAPMSRPMDDQKNLATSE